MNSMKGSNTIPDIPRSIILAYIEFSKYKYIKKHSKKDYKLEILLNRKYLFLKISLK
jgi:hypothetical protein